MGFVVCFMAYGIITINSYNKMQSMQSGIDYCMNILNQQLAEVERNIEIETEANVEKEEKTEENVIEVSNIQESELENEIKEPETKETVNNDIPQYYIVQKGDTLRTICYEMYGDYEYVEKVCKWNDIEDPNTILCGQKLLLW
jgi:LysM repeat protein